MPQRPTLAPLLAALSLSLALPGRVSGGARLGDSCRRTATIEVAVFSVGAIWLRRGQGAVGCMPSLLISLVKPVGKTT